MVRSFRSWLSIRKESSLSEVNLKSIWSSTSFFSVQKHTAHNAVKRGKSWHFMPMLQKIFVCYPGMCRVRVMEKKYEQKSVSLLSGYVQKMIAELT